MKIESLKNKKDFDRVFSGKKSFGNRHLTLLYCKNGLDHNRIGIIISKKISKKAVVRNHLRRQLREIFRSNQHRILSGYDFIIIPKIQCIDISFETLSRSFGHLFYKTGLQERDKAL